MSKEWENFLVEDKHRTFRIIAQGTTFYVNGHFLGEISSFYDAAFFGEFAEAREKQITLGTETSKNVALFLEIVHPGGRKKITEKSCGTMMRYSDIWHIPLLRAKCSEFLLLRFPQHCHSFETTFNLLEIAYVHGFQRCAEQLIARLAGFGQTFLDQQGILHQVTDTRTIAALFSAAPKEKIVLKKLTHILTTVANKSTRECTILECSNRPSHICSVCKLYLCLSHHDSIPCTKDVQFSNCVKIVPYNIGAAKIDTDLLYGSSHEK